MGSNPTLIINLSFLHPFLLCDYVTLCPLSMLCIISQVSEAFFFFFGIRNSGLSGVAYLLFVFFSSVYPGSSPGYATQPLNNNKNVLSVLANLSLSKESTL